MSLPSTSDSADAYRQALAYLESFIHGRGEPPADRYAAGRDRMAVMRELMHALGRPQDQFRSVHVGGTSGKGSTSVLIAAGLQASGHRTGLHTTPYLQHATEKLVIDGRQSSQADVVALVDGLRHALAGLPALDQQAGFVQRWTALVFMCFAQQAVDFGVIEVSLGGRYDATNVVTPAVSVITNIGHDHLEALGPTLADVAWHKAGILKPGVPAVTAATGESLAVIEQEAAAVGAPLWVVGRDVRLSDVRCTSDGTCLRVDTPAGAWPAVRLKLLGPHQAVNTATAIAALDALQVAGVAVDQQAACAALAAATVPGRFEVVQTNPTIVLDGAHNPEKAASLTAALRASFPGRQVTLVLGVGASKDLPDILTALRPVLAHVVCTEASVIAKPAVPAQALAQAVRSVGIPADAEPDPHAAVGRACGIAGPDGLVCVTGSMYLVGAVRGCWHPAVTPIGGSG
ncbi:MAG: bifunctional folylpolyglutamate synthase/dihydrofolate synthase [Dehalococcoidia bacterium]|nr:bifunctional folylpolyglutamate synthase/dihydrofolate synthase [Dehalococcoidia bacterium]